MRVTADPRVFLAPQGRDSLPRHDEPIEPGPLYGPLDLDFITYAGLSELLGRGRELREEQLDPEAHRPIGAVRRARELIADAPAPALERREQVRLGDARQKRERVEQV